MACYAIKLKNGGVGGVVRRTPPSGDGIAEVRELPRLPNEDERIDPETLEIVPVRKSWWELRREAYAEEADPLRAEALYDILVRGLKPETTRWAEAIMDIKTRYPKS